MNEQQITVSEEAALEQWNRFADEYNLGDENELSDSVKAIRIQILRDIRKGYVEIHESAEQGVVVLQHVRRPPHQGMVVLTYSAPNAGHIAKAGIGKDNATNVIRYCRLAAALTGQDEARMTLLSGGDRSRMEALAQLFLLA